MVMPAGAAGAAQLCGGAGFALDDFAGERNALAALRLAAERLINLVNVAQASASALADFRFPNRITDAHNHEYLQTPFLYPNARHLQ